MLCDATAGSGVTEKISVDLDKAVPVPELIDGEKNAVVGPYIENRSVTLQRNEVVTMNFTFHSLTRYSAFRLIFDYVVGSDKGSVAVDNQGQPFEVTGPADPNSFGSSTTLQGYRTAWGRSPGTGFREIAPGVPHPDCE